MFANNKIIKLFSIFIASGVIILIGIYVISVNTRDRNVYLEQVQTSDTIMGFDKERAFNDLEYQVSLGPRYPGSVGHDKVGEWIISEVRNSHWEIDVQELTYRGRSIKNIIAKTGEGYPWVIIGAHYDTRLIADLDPIRENRSEPVPGANDGASGVAVLLELARQLQIYFNNNSGNTDQLIWANQIWLVFFDAEDNGKLAGWDWAMGSQAFVESLTTYPSSVVIIDMVGYKTLNICYEKNSEPRLLESLWTKAYEIGYGNYFDYSNECSFLDDHTAFLEKGIPAADLIDSDYPYYHTVEDTVDKVSAESLQIIGNTIIEWLKE